MLLWHPILDPPLTTYRSNTCVHIIDMLKLGTPIQEKHNTSMANDVVVFLEKACLTPAYQYCEHLYLSGMCLRVDPRVDAVTTCL
jgi:hypothetical protein